jgi:2-oxoglutarate dehydrogenase E1 component
MSVLDNVTLANKDYVADQYRRYQDDPESVDEEWALFFAGFELSIDGESPVTGAAAGDVARPDGFERAVDGDGAGVLDAADVLDIRSVETLPGTRGRPALPLHDDTERTDGAVVRASAPEGIEDMLGATARARVSEVLGIFDLVHSYRELGHLVAHLNPLEDRPADHPLLEPSEFGIRPSDMDRVVECSNFRGCTTATVRELLGGLRATYCGTIGIEYMHIQDPEQRAWLQERMEPNSNRANLSQQEQVALLGRLIVAEGFEQFLQVRYPTQKRFSLEGAEAVIPILDVLIEDGSRLGVDELVFGMSHRGRLNVLANVLRKPYEMVLAEFEGSLLARDAAGDGDVKYHQGYSHDHETSTGANVHLSLSPNPSHLEAVNPVIEGMVKAKQARRADRAHERVVPVLVHGDAAFTGQGVVFETLWLSELKGYRTGGTVHVIVNNQIGFTTPPASYRFTPYPSAVAKVIQAPVFHVNADDPEAAFQAARLAIGFRQHFKRDVFIDLVCYRRHGHNELDDPTFTQPAMYRKIAEKQTVVAEYAARLLASGAINSEEISRRAAELRQLLQDAQDYARDFMPRQRTNAFKGLWQGFGWAGDDWSADTAVPAERITEIAAAFTRVPPGFTPHQKVARIMESRGGMVRDGERIDWACGEALAFGSLALEGVPVRLTGQDTERGTFSHRHAVLYDLKTGARHVPLDHIREGQAQFRVLNSMLSENAVLGFEFGVSIADPHQLVVWEAQFGDFCNGAQVVIDQFIASSESKWQRTSGLVLLLPHGYEGQGPEHSSARLERFLQLGAENNMQICSVSTPAQYFHVLRRQVHRPFRKPLILMTPKSLLRYKLAVSPLRDFTDGTFQVVIDDPAVADAREPGMHIERARVTRVLLCSGKVYYTLLAERRERVIDTVALVRVEQLYPCPYQELTALFASYPNVEQIYWVQEEPWNMGAWHVMHRRLLRIVPEGCPVSYVGRPEAASPATGVFRVHQQEEADMLMVAFGR